MDALPGTACVVDLVYSPRITTVLEAAAKLGRRTIDGLGMLLHQARPGFESWFGVAPQVTPALRTFVLES